jgi:chitinase
VLNGCSRIVRSIIPSIATAAATAAVIAVLTAGCATQAKQAAPTGGAPTAPYDYWAAPYDYLAAGGPPPAQVMKATGIGRFTLAFIVSDGTCTPVWDAPDPLTGSPEEAAIRDIRAAGGDVAVSFGGAGGTKLALTCTSPEALAGAYQKVISAYRLHAIDLDAEDAEIATATVRQRMVNALIMLRRRDPGLMISITMAAEPDGPDASGRDLIERAAVGGLRVDAWTIMPFDFSAGMPDMGRASVQAAEGLKNDLMSAYHESSSAAYRTMGISSANGRTETGETVTEADFQTMLRYVRAHQLARFAFWSVNRDRPCTQGSTEDSCSGIAQAPYAFTSIVADYRR